MASWLPLFLFGGAMLLGLVVIAIYQTRAYRRYLAQHMTETAKVTDGQREIIAAQAVANQLVLRQAEALERIARVMEAKDGRA